MSKPYYKKLTRTESYLLEALIENGQPAVTKYTFFRLIQGMYREGKNLYLRHELPTESDQSRILRNMYRAGVVRYDKDYGDRLIRVLDISEQSTEDIVCLADPLCYISHLSAMQRWGLTNRYSYALICTRPDRNSSTVKLFDMMSNHLDSLPPEHFRMKFIKHPDKVRNRPIHMLESKNASTGIDLRGTRTRIATIGQTFLDMLQKPMLCGGMSHVLDVYDEYATTWANEIIACVDSTSSKIVKCRAGYILEDRLNIHHEKFGNWKDLAQRGGSRKLDPSKPFSSKFSNTWMISLNA